MDGRDEIPQKHEYLGLACRRCGRMPSSTLHDVRSAQLERERDEARDLQRKYVDAAKEFERAYHAVNDKLAALRARPCGPHEAMHPIQPLAVDARGVLRFKSNAIVTFLAVGEKRLNDLATMGFCDEDWQQLAQLIGYSLSGYGDLSYVTDEAYARAECARVVAASQQPAPGVVEQIALHQLAAQPAAAEPEGRWTREGAPAGGGWYAYCSANGAVWLHWFDGNEEPSSSGLRWSLPIQLPPPPEAVDE